MDNGKGKRIETEVKRSGAQMGMAYPHCTSHGTGPKARMPSLKLSTRQLANVRRQA